MMIMPVVVSQGKDNARSELEICAGCVTLLHGSSNDHSPTEA